MLKRAGRGCSSLIGSVALAPAAANPAAPPTLAPAAANPAAPPTLAPAAAANPASSLSPLMRLLLLLLLPCDTDLVVLSSKG